MVCDCEQHNLLFVRLQVYRTLVILSARIDRYEFKIHLPVFQLRSDVVADLLFVPVVARVEVTSIELKIPYTYMRI